MTSVLVIGAGPAGLAAADAARALGADITLLDAADQSGGQYWRHLPPSRAGAREERLHHGWKRYAVLRDALDADERVRTVLGAQVWAVDRSADGALRVHVLVGPADGRREPAEYRADAIILATGAHDRALPFPGWTLPGVYTAGAAQALAKGERVAVGERVVVSGAGPFLLPVAASLQQAGARVVSVHEASRPGRLARGWLPRPWRLLSAGHKFGELAGYVAGHLRHRIPYRLGEGVIAAHGRDRVEAVTVARLDAQWNAVPGTERRVAADAVCVGHGFTPRVELAVAIGCRLDADRFVVVDDMQQTSVAGVYAAGEVTGIGGADAALAEGRLAGLAAAGAARAAVRSAQRHRDATDEFAGRLEAAHGIRDGWRSWLDDDTIVCRCEEVRRGALRATAEATCQDSLRSLKLTTRAGLGICQGRVCGRTVEQLLGTAPDAGTIDNRPIVTPVRFAELSAMPPHPTTPGRTP